ncbi:hypothetical protein B0H66DRAFT_532323 [Apodospora peruviana]|uniref:Protein kinase domain-containing protein n=1 Tax=Apodospora peruviana TaxID=516989 RepID=A0AAE0IDX9_9PEZI|nr:hypothetical protein B0H66DRAFT_532323 [Apodospora peruviana]
MQPEMGLRLQGRGRHPNGGLVADFIENYESNKIVISHNMVNRFVFHTLETFLLMYTMHPTRYVWGEAGNDLHLHFDPANNPIPDLWLVDFGTARPIPDTGTKGLPRDQAPTMVATNARLDFQAGNGPPPPVGPINIHNRIAAVAQNATESQIPLCHTYMRLYNLHQAYVKGQIGFASTLPFAADDSYDLVPRLRIAIDTVRENTADPMTNPKEIEWGWRRLTCYFEL